jgi:hypothetical protein
MLLQAAKPNQEAKCLGGLMEGGVSQTPVNVSTNRQRFRNQLTANLSVSESWRFFIFLSSITRAGHWESFFSRPAKNIKNL